MRRSQLHFLWRDRSVQKRFRCGVSLHSHTYHSQENLAMIPRYTDGVPLVSDAGHPSPRAKPLISKSASYSKS